MFQDAEDHSGILDNVFRAVARYGNVRTAVYICGYRNWITFIQQFLILYRETYV